MKLSSLSSLVVTALTAAAIAAPAQAGPPARGLPYTGRLELNGVPVSSDVPMNFKIYDAASGGNLLFEQTIDPVSVSAGAFAVVLGTVAGNLLPESVFTYTNVYLAIAVNGTPLNGRQQIYANPQAVRAGQAEEFVVTGNIRGGNAGAGNLHIDSNNPAGADGRIYLNWYSGRGVVIGNGAQGGAASVDTSGNLSTTGSLYTLGAVTGSSVSTTGTVTAANVDTSGWVFTGLHQHSCGIGPWTTTDCQCPNGEKVLGGGATCGIGYLFESRPYNDTTWRVTCAWGESHEWYKYPSSVDIICARIGN